MVCLDSDVDVVLFSDEVDVFSDADSTSDHITNSDTEANLPPPVETWMIPSDLSSAKAFRAALAVISEVTLMAGYAKLLLYALSNILQYVS